MKLFIVFAITFFCLNCSTGINPDGGSSAGGATTSGQILSPTSGGAGSGAGISSAGTLTMSSSIGQAISNEPQVSSSGRFERQ